MSRQLHPLIIVLGVLTAMLTGCQPQQPFYLFEDGDLSHYLDQAGNIDYPDLEEESLAEVDGSLRPLSLDNSVPKEVWPLSLEEAVQTALANSKVMKSIGGQIQGMPDFLLRAPELATTIYDPAITESNPRLGTEAALSAFDAQFSSSIFWEKNNSPRNFSGFNNVFPPILNQELGNFQAQLSKWTASGGEWSLRHNVQYEWNDTQIRRYPSDWNVNVEAEFRQPLLQGNGVQLNRITGPGAIPGFNNGVMIARIRTDITLADFEAGVRDLVSNVEIAYWELYYAYRFLEAMKAGRDSGLQTWRETYAKQKAGDSDRHEEARARQQYFIFRNAMERALSDLFAAESKLRYMMGLAATDGRLVRPADEPTIAKVAFDWHAALAEGLVRSVELRKERWIVKQRELELIAAKNYLLPNLDAVGRYRWLGLGDELLQASGGSGNPALLDSNAYQSMTNGQFQESYFGLDLSFPLGFRKENAGVRHAQLNLARERARLQEQKLEFSHQLAYVIRDLEAARVLAKTNFNRLAAAKVEVRTAEVLVREGAKDPETQKEWTLDALLDAQRRLAEAEADFYRSVVDYNKSIAQVHFVKGSLLEYNGVYLTEGPWPGKAYFDAHRRARKRDASLYLNYGFTRPSVISRGPYNQHAGRAPAEEMFVPDESAPELVPTPEPMVLPGEPPQPESADNGASEAPSAEAPGVDAPELLRLAVPAARADGQASAGGGWSAVRQAGFDEPIAPTPDDATGARTAGTNPSPAKWTRSKRTNVGNESLANPSAAEIDRPASGWKRAQR